MASITIKVLSFLSQYSLRNNSGVQKNRVGLENFLKINNQKGWNKLGAFTIKAMYISISCFHIFFQILRRTLKKKIVNNEGLT